jgi:hypothetical protein
MYYLQMGCDNSFDYFVYVMNMGTYMDKREIRKGLEESAGRVCFNDLKVDILKDVIFLVSPDLVLLDVAEACALDDGGSFTGWLEKGLVKKPEEVELSYWKEENVSFDCVIVKPFIFLQKAALN